MVRVVRVDPAPPPIFREVVAITGRRDALPSELDERIEINLRSRFATHRQVDRTGTPPILPATFNRTAVARRVDTST